MERYITRSRFNDFGQYREQLRGWDTDAVQISRGVLSMEVDRLAVSDLILMHLQFDRDTSFRTTFDLGWYGLVVSLTPRRWCGLDLPSGSVCAIAPRQEVNCIAHGVWDSISIAIRRETVANWGSPFAELLDREFTPERGIFEAVPSAVKAFREWTELLFGTVLSSTTDEERIIWLAAIRERLQRHLLDILGHRKSPMPLSRVHRVARYDLVLSALRLIQPEADSRITVTELALGLGVSIRALEYAFHTVIGISPAQYILAERLNRARHHLATCGGRGASVTTVAFDHRFENLSRFAHQYTRLFGERPSDTLRAARVAFVRA